MNYIVDHEVLKTVVVHRRLPEPAVVVAGLVVDYHEDEILTNMLMMLYCLDSDIYVQALCILLYLIDMLCHMGWK